MFRPEGELAVKELCESLESTRAVLAERAGQAQLETTGLEPLPQDRRSLKFVQAVFKHNFSPSNIEDAITALKDFQFEVESCQQTTELAFQQVWRVYDIVKSRTLQRRSSVSTKPTITTITPESSTGPQATTSFRNEVIDWLAKQDVASKSNSATPNIVAQIERGTRPGTPAEENTSTSMSQPLPITRDQEMSRTRDRMRNIFGLSRARQEHGYMRIEPFPLDPPPPQPLVLHAPQRRVRTNQDVSPNQRSPMTTPIYDRQFPMTTPIYDQDTQPVRPEKPSRRHSQMIPWANSPDSEIPPRSPSPDEPAEDDQDGTTGIALFDFTGDASDELSVKEGGTLLVIDWSNENWWKCRNQVGQEGVMPASYISLDTDDTPGRTQEDSTGADVDESAERELEEAAAAAAKGEKERKERKGIEREEEEERARAAPQPASVLKPEPPRDDEEVEYPTAPPPSPPPPPAPPVPVKVEEPKGLTALVVYPYEAQEENEIDLIEDEYIYDIEQLDDGWWSGTTAEGRSGLFPANYVELVEIAPENEPEPEIPPPPSPPPLLPSPPPVEESSGSTAIALYGCVAPSPRT